MDKLRKKELLMQYKLLKPDMGIYIFECLKNKKCYIGYAKDLKAVHNSSVTKLDSNFHPNKQLQKDWTEFGKENFSVRFLEVLPYSKNESKDNYKEELEVLRDIWMEKIENSISL